MKETSQEGCSVSVRYKSPKEGLTGRRLVPPDVRGGPRGRAGRRVDNPGLAAVLRRRRRPARHGRHD